MGVINKKLLATYMERAGIQGLSALAKQCKANRMTLYNLTHYGRAPSYGLMQSLQKGLSLSPEETGRLFFTQTAE